MCPTMLAKVFDIQVSTSGSLLLRLSHQRKGLSTQPPSVPGTVPSYLPSQPPKRLTSDASLQQSCPVRTPLDDPTRSDWNVISDSSSGDPNNILVVDAHLDAIYGAGILDNASGSATILDIAQQLKNTNTRNKLRFI